MTSQDPGQLSAEELGLIFSRKIQPEYDQVIAQWADGARVLVVVGAQPGAGKTRAVSDAAADHPGAVQVVGDDLRLFHPRYDELMSSAPLRMPEVTAQASGAWVGMSLDYLQSQGRSVVLETTMRQPAAVEATLRGFREAGYTTEVRALAVSEEASRLGTVDRYVRQVREVGAGRWTPSRFHDDAYTQMPDTLATVIDAGLVDRSIVVSRAGRVLWDERRGVGLSSAEARAAVVDGRSLSSMPSHEGRQWLDSYQAAAEFLRDTRETDSDLLMVAQRLGGRVETVAERAYPFDEVTRATRVSEVMTVVNDLPKPPVLRDAFLVSFPPPVAGMTRTPSSVGSPRARTHTPHPGYGQSR